MGDEGRPQSGNDSNEIGEVLPNIEKNDKNENEPRLKGFFHPDLGDARKKISLGFGGIYLLYGVLILAILSIYWGSLYERETRTTNLNILVINWDSKESTDYLRDHNIKPVVGDAVLQSLGEVSGVLGWEVRDDLNQSDIEYIYHLVHQRRSWGAIVIHPNSTEKIHRAMSNAESSFTPEGLIEAVYEQATDMTATGSYVVPGFYQLQTVFQKHVSNEIYAPLLDSLSNDQKTDLIRDAPTIVSQPISFELKDNLPVQSMLLMAPLQIGLIYLIILSFFQFNCSIAIHMNFVGKLKQTHFLFYRWLSAQLSYFVISLFYSLLTLAFQVDTGFTFGKSGFLVFWMINFLGMSAVGGANENMSLVLFAYFPPALGFWLLFWVISNISPAYGPIQLCPKFYRYGYAFPIYNILEATRVVLCDTTKRTLGRHIGVLIAWIAVNTIILPIALKINARKMSKSKK
ncbi:hypothetical protein TRICI_000742 [Trichomonascus ciferrii]|uniref:DUF3533 domain-containing protein n=1 Tax=Trichomonascus ciferrii TaxID=44093 RepID=A0A642VAC9_9ASCO|nr:hypothetical protein TRICI_000742 [Trichomonascus ciferrii]